MAEFKRTGNGIGYILCNYAQSIMYCENNLPKCGECNEKLMDDNCMFIPYTNEIYHKHCGENVLKNMKNYREDKSFRLNRERNYINWFRQHGFEISGVDDQIETQVKSKDFVIKKQENYNLRWLDDIIENTNGFIAGGCFKNIFNGEKCKDLDVFFRNKNDWEEAVKLYKAKQDWKIKYENSKVIAFENDDLPYHIELINTVFGTPEEIINDFDFDITKFSYFKDVDNQFKCIMHKDFFEHLHMKRLIIDNKITYPLGTFQRVLRYTKYGYGLCRDSKIKLIKSINNMNKKEINNESISNSLYDGID